MRNSKKIIFYTITSILLIFISILLIISKYKIYSILSMVLLIIDLILLYIYLRSTKSSQAIYNNDLKYILRTFDSVLAYLDCDLKTRGKEIIRLDSFDSLVNCQEEIKKPILYKYDEESAIFVLVDRKIVYFTTLKADEKNENELEIKLISKMNSKNDIDDDSSILDSIDKTTIIQTKNNKKYKVSPVRENNESNSGNVSNTEVLNFVKDQYFPKIKEEKKNK